MAAAGAGARSIDAEKLNAARDNILVAGDYYAAQTAGYSPLHQLPSPPDLVGRDDELAALLQQLTAAGASGATISAQHAGLQGMGGVGKTALAIVLAHRLKDRYPDAQLFLNLHAADATTPEMTPLDAMQRIIHCFRPDARLPDSVDEVAPIYRSVLAEAGRVLLVLDNAAVAQVQPLLPPPNCLLLVTSRAQFKLPGLVQRNLDCLDPAKSVELLCKLFSRWQGEEAKDAAELCGHLPLALEVFAGAVNDKSLTPVPELLARLRAGLDKLAPVDAAFEVSYGLLKEHLPAAWVALAVFPASFDLHAAAAVWGARPPSGAVFGAAPDTSERTAGEGAGSDARGGSDPEELEAARATMQALVNASLVEWNAAAGRFRLHDLVRAFCDGKLDAAARAELHFAHARHYTVIAGVADALYLTKGKATDGLALFDRERAQIEAAFAWLDAEVGRAVLSEPPANAKGGVAAPSRRAEDSQPYLPAARHVIALVDAVVHTGDLRFHPRQRIAWLESQLRAARLVKVRESESNALGNLGLAHYYLGDAREAIEFYEQQLIITRDISNRLGEGTALGNLGLAHAALGDSRKAIEFYEQYLAIAREIGNRRGEGNALGNLGLAHADLGDARKAIGYHERALVVMREVGDRRAEGSVLGNLGIVHASLGDARKAIEFYEQRLIIARELGDRRGEGNALGNLGIANKNLGEARKAIEFHEQNLAIARETGDRRSEASTLGNLGNTYASLGNARKATEFYEQHLVIAREIGDRRGEGNSMFNAAVAYELLGNRPEAIARAEAALRIFEAIEDPNATKARANLAKWRA